jgi:hypothetical protein
VVLKIFTAEFYSIGALFAAYGAGVLAVGLYRRREGHRIFFVVGGEGGGNGNGSGWRGRWLRRKARIQGGRGDGEQQHQHQQPDEVGEAGSLATEKSFRTSGNVVVVLTLLSVTAYATLLVLTLRLGDSD